MYSVYRSKEMDTFQKHRVDSINLFNYYRDNKLEESISILKEGMNEYEKLKSEWSTILSTVDSVGSLERLKELIALALHYCTLVDLATGADVETFIKNPYDAIFSDSRTMSSACWVVSNRIKEFPTKIRRLRYLNKFKLSEKDLHFDKFNFDASLESRDMMYGCKLFDTLLTYPGSDEITRKFVVNCIERILLLTNNDENLSAMYSIYIDVKNLYDQRGGGSDVRVSKFNSTPNAAIVRIGDYIVDKMMGSYSSYQIIVSEIHPYTVCFCDIGESMIEHLIYKKNIIPKRYIEYLKESNKEYEVDGEEGPYHEMIQFLKRKNRIQLKRNKNKRTIRPMRI